MKALVVGGAGFIGSHLCDALLAEGHQVVCVDDFSIVSSGNGKTVKEDFEVSHSNIGHLLDRKDFVLYKMDAAVLGALDEIFEKEKPEYVFHMAANSDIQASAMDPQVEYRNTYTTTFEILSCMRKYDVKKLFFASTSAVYGDKRDVLLDENTPNLAPVSYYGAAKLGSEALISAFSYMNGMDVLVFRFPNVIGPRLTHGVIFDFIRKLRKDPGHLQILGDGRQTKPYIYVLDLVDAIMKFKDSTESGVRLYNVGVEGESSVTKIADIICEEMQLSDVEYQYTGGEGGWKGDVPRFKYCTDKINKAGWKPSYTSDEAVRQSVRDNM